METINKIFNYYDQLLAPLSASYRILISFVLMLILIWTLYKLFKSGQWIFLAVLVLMLPGTWPATKIIFLFIYSLFKGLFVRLAS